MKVFWSALIVAGCIFGGVVVISLSFLILTFLIFGVQGTDDHAQFVHRWIPMVWLAGAVFGILVMLPSERRRVAR